MCITRYTSISVWVQVLVCIYFNLPVVYHNGVLVESVQHTNSQVHHLTFHVHWEINTLAPCQDRYLYGERDSKKQQD